MNIDVNIENVTVSYRENIAIKNISLKIPAGAFLSIIGPNGAGKTTLLTVINGLSKIISGTVTICGKRLIGKNLSEIRKITGYVPQYLNIDPRFPASVRDIVCIGRFCRIGLINKWTSEDEKLVRTAMQTVGISHLAERPIGHLSGGELQKVAIARALSQGPSILLLDEPTSNLDPKSQNNIISLIENIYKEKKITTVFVTHVLSHIPECCSNVVLMKEANIFFTGNVNEALDENRLSELYGCPVQITIINGKRHFHMAESHP